MVKKLKPNLPHLIRRKEESLKLDRRITNREVADAIGVSEQAIGRWMRGDVSQANFELLERFMRYFDCTLDELLILEEMPEASN